MPKHRKTKILATGTCYGKLTVVKDNGDMIDCQCACGSALVEIPRRSLMAGWTKSCGCISRKLKPIAAGTTFARLTVIEPVTSAVSVPTYRCQCSCGKETSVSAKSLRSGNTQSCGCLAIDSRKETCGHVNEMFGRLTIIARDGVFCDCLCECGRTFRTRWGSIQQGSVKSCGCLRVDTVKEMSEKPIAAGTVFARLRVMEWNGKNCRCLCECGRTVVIPSTKLRTGKTKSCGCLQRERAGLGQRKEAATGEKFGRLTVISSYRKPGKGTWCLCECTDGARLEVKLSKLRNGSTQSCGCLATEKLEDSREARTLDTGLAAFQALYAIYKSNAARRGLCFELTKAEFRNLTGQNCHYCGAPPVPNSYHGNGKYSYNGIDRVNNEIGYVHENCKPACQFCNRVKSNLSVSAFKEWVIRRSEHTPTIPAVGDQIEKKFDSCADQAAKRGLPFSLTLKSFTLLVTAPCAYCGQPAAPLNGIDREVNRLGYTEGNSVAACWDCNRVKKNMPALRYREWLARVVKAAK